jgi:ABC-type antimicrobial peptide transport system permease subunit
MPGVGDQSFYVYALLQPAAQAGFDGPRPALVSPPHPQPVNNGGSYRFLDVMVRVDSPTVLPHVLSTVQRVDPRMQTRARFVDEIYVEQHADVLLATRVIGGFGIVAFITAMAGLYGVMAFLVTSRTREIGIRIALGATTRDIVGMVFASSGTLVVAGALLGIVGASWASRWIEAQLFGVSPTDPATYAMVALGAVLASAVATWRPARQAARVDPALTLRAE